jgi:hypothetical protein
MSAKKGTCSLGTNKLEQLTRAANYGDVLYLFSAEKVI